MLITGGCHCKNMRFTLLWEPTPIEIAGRACTCSFCVKHGGVWTSHPPGVLKIHIEDPEALDKYRFGTQTADFYVCSRCGCVPVVCCNVDARVLAVVNTNTFDADYRRMVRSAPITHGEEDESARLARRVRNWIGQVEVSFLATPNNGWSGP